MHHDKNMTLLMPSLSGVGRENVASSKFAKFWGMQNVENGDGAFFYLPCPYIYNSVYVRIDLYLYL